MNTNEVVYLDLMQGNVGIQVRTIQIIIVIEL